MNLLALYTALIPASSLKLVTPPSRAHPDPAPGARLCEPQQLANSQRHHLDLTRVLTGQVAAGRRPALRCPGAGRLLFGGSVEMRPFMCGLAKNDCNARIIVLINTNSMSLEINQPACK